MARTSSVTTKETPARRSPQHLAREAADKYFAALAADLPFDTAPGDVNLVELCTQIHDAILRERQHEADQGYRRPNVDNEDSAMRAGYLLGVEIGRRLSGGVR